MAGEAPVPRWALVVGGRLDDPARAEAWRALGEAFRPPVVAALRERFEGRRPVEDLATAFFAFLRSIRPEPGDRRLLPHLARLLRVFLHDLHNGRIGVSAARLTPAGKAEERAALRSGSDAFAAAPPDAAFLSRWTECLLHAALRRLRATHPEFHGLLLRFHDRRPEAGPASPDETARRLGLAREALAARFREEMAHTLAAGASLDAECALLRPHTGGLLGPTTAARA